MAHLWSSDFASQKMTGFWQPSPTAVAVPETRRNRLDDTWKSLCIEIHPPDSPYADRKKQRLLKTAVAAVGGTDPVPESSSSPSPPPPPPLGLFDKEPWITGLPPSRRRPRRHKQRRTALSAASPVMVRHRTMCQVFSLLAAAHLTSA
eukprot:Protomagalhaensia_sp_Gyna_25__2423@NODE_234_length_4247_cov_257_341968_g161_i1_p3_GENE_NODE_234_length_4247_cov_257_341968_g161_i1NODE_234_length_4247_cov_257_341968_g161_i1_p3_ORF_typecomplete_len148_score21_15_NODE_234_length_4247_cov_257_341968_g161_i112811724